MMKGHLLKHFTPAASPANRDSCADGPLYAGAGDAESPCGAGIQAFGDQRELAGVGDDLQQYIEQVIEAAHSPWDMQAAEIAFDPVSKVGFFFFRGLIQCWHNAHPFLYLYRLALCDRRPPACRRASFLCPENCPELPRKCPENLLRTALKRNLKAQQKTPQTVAVQGVSVASR